MMAIGKKTFTLLLVFFLLSPFLALANAKSQSTDAQLLFVILAKKGEIKAIKGKKDEYTLTLTNVTPSVMYFTNTPKRYTSKILMSNFIKGWDVGSFKHEPPNAMIEAVRLHTSFFKKNKKSVTYAVELKDPHYTPSEDKLTFNIKQLAGSGEKLPDVSKADYVALFIDNALVCPDCIGY